MERQPERWHSKYTQGKPKQTGNPQGLPVVMHVIQGTRVFILRAGSACAYLPHYTASKTYSQRAALD